MSSSEPKKYAYIDALRGIAATGIIFHHVPRAYLSQKINAFLDIGTTGVPLFFMLSAFTIFLSFSNRKSGTEKHVIRNFYIRRFFRIAPLFYVLLVYFLWQDGLAPRVPGDPNSAVSLVTILANVTFTFGLHPYWISSIVHSGWSVGTEMLFYVFAPFIFLHVFNTRRALWFLIFSIFVSKVIVYGIAHFLPGHVSAAMVKSDYWINYLYMCFPSQLTIFALGILLFYLVQDFAKHRREETFPAFNKALATPILILFTILVVSNSLKKFSTDGLVPGFVTTNGIPFLLFIFSLYLYPNKLLVNPVTTYLGKISYSLYLTHSVAIHFTEILFHNYVAPIPIANYALHFGTTLLLTLLFSNITYYLVEKPGQKLGKKLIDKLETEPHLTAFTTQ